MSRPMRVGFPEAFYHIMSAGNGRQWIALEDKDFDVFCDILVRVAEKYKLKLYSFILMRNHYHLFLEIQKPNISFAIAMLNREYAKYINKKRIRSGSVFRARFKATLVQKEEYFSKLNKYIHRNPIRAKTTEQVRDYTWSSYPYITGERSSKKISRILHANKVLSSFGKTDRERLKNYREDIEIPLKDYKEIVRCVEKGHPFLGKKDWIDKQKKELLKIIKKNSQVTGSKKITTIENPDKIIEAVSKELNKKKEEITNPKYGDSDGMRILIYLLSRFTDLKGKEIGEILGGRSPIVVSKHLQMFKKTQLHKQEYARLIKKIIGKNKFPAS